MKHEKPSEDRLYGVDIHNRGKNCDDWTTCTLVVDLVPVVRGLGRNLLRCSTVIRAWALRELAAERKAKGDGK